MILGKGKFG